VIADGVVGDGRPTASAISGARITQPSSPPTNINEAIFGPIIHPTPKSAGEEANPPIFHRRRY